MAAEADSGRDMQEELITSSFYVMKIFKYDIFQMRKMPVSTFNMLLVEIKKDSDAKQKQMDDSKKKTF